MPRANKPRSGSLQFWPRKRTHRRAPRIGTYATAKDVKLTAFAGYKVGMTHVMAIETNKNSHMKGDEIAIPVTIIECPPIKVSSVRLYKKSANRIVLVKETTKLTDIKPEEYVDLRLNVVMQPSLTGIGKKDGETIEMSIGGKTVSDKLNFAKEHIGKEISFESVFAEGELVDVKSFTKGKGFQGPMARFGIGRRQHKSEKAIKNPGSLGPWNAQGKIMWRVPHAGKTGYAQRTEYNKQILKFTEGKDVNPKGGMISYGTVKTKAILIKGSISGARKRLVLMQKAIRQKKQKSLPTIETINTSEKQGR